MQFARNKPQAPRGAFFCLRYLGDLRHMGCRIVSVRDSSGSVYRLENGEDVVDKMSRWLRLEQERTLLQ